MERTRRRHVRSPLDTATPVAIRAMERTRLRHVRSSRSLPHATSHALPRAAPKLPSQDDKGRAATVGGRRGRVTSMFSIPLVHAARLERCDADACRRRDDARGGARCGDAGRAFPDANCDGGSYASQPIAPAGTATPGPGVVVQTALPLQQLAATSSSTLHAPLRRRCRRRRDDARGTRCGDAGRAFPDANCDGGSYASQPIAPAGTATPGLGVVGTSSHLPPRSLPHGCSSAKRRPCESKTRAARRSERIEGAQGVGPR